MRNKPFHALAPFLGLVGASLAFFILDTGACDQRAAALAEAGLRESFGALCRGGTGRIGSPDDPVYLGTAVMWVEATPLGNDRTRLLSTAVAGGGRRSVEAIVFHPHGEDPVLVAMPPPVE